jgi:SPP1 gp7 family putative phage head morphogenesis protein
MSRPLEEVMRDFLRAFQEGYRAFEIVYRAEDGLLVIDKIAARSVYRSESEIKILVDEEGEPIGIRQRVGSGGRYRDVDIVDSGDVSKYLLVTFGKEYGSNYGRSGIKAAWYHYDKAHKSMFLVNTGIELGAVKARVIKKAGAVDADDATDQDIIDVFQNVWQETTALINGNQYEVEVLDLSDAAVLNVGLDNISKHESKMAMSVLAQFLQLGSEASATGSRSLGDTQVNVFRDGLQSIARTLLEAPLNKLIADLVRINFNNDIYPTIVWNPISDTDTQIIFDAFMEMVKKGAIPENMQDKLAAKASENLGLGLTEKELSEARGLDEEKKLAEAETQFSRDMEMMESKKPVPADNNKREFADAIQTAIVQDNAVRMTPPVDSENIIRELFENEKKVPFVDIKRQLETASRDGERILAEKMSLQRDAIIQQYIEAVRSGTKSITNVSIQLADSENGFKYSEALLLTALTTMNFGKDVAATEIGQSPPKTPLAVRARLTEMIRRTIGKQESDLEFRMQTIAQQALDANRPENETRILLEAEYDDYFSKTIKTGLRTTLSDALNTGRGITFANYQDQIYAYRYSAVIDSGTTDYCRTMDGRVFQFNDPNFAMVTPPNHYGCRSIWTVILIGEEDGVVVDGTPGSIPIYGASLNRFKDVLSVAELSDDPFKRNKQILQFISSEIEEGHSHG